MSRLSRVQASKPQSKKGSSKNICSSTLDPKHVNSRSQATKEKSPVKSQGSSSLKSSRKASKTPTPSRNAVRKQVQEEPSSSDEEEVAAALPPTKTGGKRKGAPASFSSAPKTKKSNTATQPTAGSSSVVNNQNAGIPYENLLPIGIDEATFKFICSYNKPLYVPARCTCNPPGGTAQRKGHSNNCPKKTSSYPSYLVDLLKVVFNHQKLPNLKLREKLSTVTGLPEQNIKKWFGNRRERIRANMRKQEARAASIVTIEEDHHDQGFAPFPTTADYHQDLSQRGSRDPEYDDEEMAMTGVEERFLPNYEELALEEAYELPPLPQEEGSSGYSGNRFSGPSHGVYMPGANNGMLQAVPPLRFDGNPIPTGPNRWMPVHSGQQRIVGQQNAFEMDHTSQKFPQPPVQPLLAPNANNPENMASTDVKQEVESDADEEQKYGHDEHDMEEEWMWIEARKEVAAMPRTRTFLPYNRSIGMHVWGKEQYEEVAVQLGMTREIGERMSYWIKGPDDFFDLKYEKKRLYRALNCTKYFYRDNLISIKQYLIFCRNSQKIMKFCKEYGL